MNAEKRVTTRTVAVTGMMLAVTLILMFTPLGLIPLPVVSLTTMQIPVVITALAVGPVEGLIVGAGFHFDSRVHCAIRDTGPLFYEPVGVGSSESAHRFGRLWPVPTHCRKVAVERPQDCGGGNRCGGG